MALPKLFQRIFWHNNTTPALAEDNLNAMSKGLSDVDDRLISLAGTIQEDVVEIQEDMEILNAALETIDDSVASAQGSASTASAKATIASNKALIAEGFAVGEQNGTEVGQDSDYYENNAKYYANIANPPIRVLKDYAPIISITDAINKKARDIKIKLELQQDLHGYTKPWPGGAGKNLMPLDMITIKANNAGTGTWNGNIYTLHSVVFNFITDEANNIHGVKINGTATGGAPFVNLTNNKVPISGMVGKLVTGCTGGSSTTYDLRLVYRNSNGGWITSDAQTSNPLTIRSNVANAEYIQMGINVAEGTTVNTTMYPMISTDGGTFEPYKNECPITGWSQIQLARVGIQQWDEEWEVGAIAGSTGDIVTYANRIRSKNFTPCKGNTKYRVAIGFNVNLRIFWYDASKTYLGYDQVNASSGADIISREKAAFFKISTEGSTYGETYRSDISVNYPSTDHDYHAFQGNYYIILLNGMYYGARYDATSGEFVVDRGYKIYDGSSDEQWQHPSGWADGAFYINAALSDAVPVSGFSTIANIISNLGESQRADYLANGTKMGVAQGGNTNIYGSFGAEYNTEEKFRTFLSNNNMQVVYPLATPITLTKTALALELFFGNNTLYANSGDVALEYDASGIVRIAEAKLDIDVFKEVVAASSDFANFKSRVAQL